MYKHAREFGGTFVRGMLSYLCSFNKFTRYIPSQTDVMVSPHKVLNLCVGRLLWPTLETHISHPLKTP